MDQLTNLPSQQILPYLARFRRRLRLRDGLLMAQHSLWMAMLASLLVLLAGRIWPIEQPYKWALIPLGIWLLAVIAYSLFRPLPPMRVARKVDAELSLKERLSTSLALDQTRAMPIFSAFDPALVEQAHADALNAARLVNPAHDFPLSTQRRAFMVAGGILLAAGLLIWLPNPMTELIEERKAVAEEAQRQAQQIDRLREQVEQSKEMSPEERDELLRRLAELSQKLKANNGEREQALADLSKMEEALRQKIDPQAGQRQAALAAMAAQMQAMAKSPNPQIGDLEAAAEAMQKLAEQMPEMTEEERDAAAQQLAQMASRASQAGESGLAQALSSMSQAMQSGDPSAAQQAAQKASDALNQAQTNQANQQALSQSLSQLQNSRQRIAQAGQTGQQRAQSGQQGQQGQPGQGQQGQPGQGQGQGQGQQPGQGQGQPGQGTGQQGQSGQTAGGGGTNANSLPPSTRTGKAGAPQGPGKDSGTGSLDSQVYTPREKRTTTSGEEIFIPGQDTGQGETQTKESRDPASGALNPALVPYNTIYQTYREAASRAMDQSYIPPALKGYIQEYFSQLEPGQ